MNALTQRERTTLKRVATVVTLALIAITAVWVGRVTKPAVAIATDTTMAPAMSARVPACEEVGDALRGTPMHWGRWCVYEDDINTPGTSELILIAPDGRGTLFPACETEDSVLCIWDSATMGNRNAPVDSPTRYVVNGR